MTETPEPFIALPSEEEVRAQMPPGVKNPYDFGFISKMSRLLSAHPRIGKAMRGAFGEIMFAPGALDRAEREMVAAVTSAAQDCEFWTESHAEFLRAENGNPELVEAIRQRRWRELPGLTARQRALCTVAEKLTTKPLEMTAADWQPLRDLGFDDEGLLEVGHLIAIFNYFPRMADGFGLKPDPQIRQAAATGVPLRRPNGS